MLNKIKTIYWDMDGTIADLYGVENWLPMLRAENPLPYVQATPMLDMPRITMLCQKLQLHGVKIGLITWLAMNATRSYKDATRAAKKLWLSRYMPIEFDETHFVQYGTPKHIIARDRYGLIIDDDVRVRDAWENYGIAINPQYENVEHFLEMILNEVC